MNINPSMPPLTAIKIGDLDSSKVDFENMEGVEPIKIAKDSYIRLLKTQVISQPDEISWVEVEKIDEKLM